MARTGAWSAPESDYLRRAFGCRTVESIARRLRRSEASVRARARVLFGGPRRRGPWESDEDRRLREGFGAVPDAELALSLQRTVADVRARVRLLRTIRAAHPWSSADDARLRRMFGSRDDDALAVCLQRSVAEVVAAAARLCLHKDRRFLARTPAAATRMPRWSDADVLRLRALYPDRENLEVARELGRSVQSVANKAYQLGLHKRKRWLRHAGRASAARRGRAEAGK